MLVILYSIHSKNFRTILKCNAFKQIEITNYYPRDSETKNSQRRMKNNNQIYQLGKISPQIAKKLFLSKKYFLVATRSARKYNSYHGSVQRA